MHNFFKSTTCRTLLCLLIALALGVITAAVANNGTSPLSGAVSVLFSPLQTVSAALQRKLDGFGEYFRYAGTYLGEIESLQNQVEEYRVQLVDYEKMRQQLDTYEDFLGLKEENGNFVFASASVISRDGTDVYNSFVVNKGAADGIAVGMPVVCGSYLVGTVREVNPTSSTVYTVLHPAVNIAAYEIRTGEEGFVTTDTGLALQGRCKLARLSDNTAVGSGGIVCTSGIGGNYPRDLIIGTVRSVENETADISAYAILEPGISISDVLDVFIITSFTG